MKNILVLCSFFILSHYGYSQGLRAGIKLGTNATFLVDNNSSLHNIKERFERGNGYQIGIEASYTILNRIGLRAETNYQNNEFSFIQNKIVDVLPNGETTTDDAIVNEKINVKNGSFRFGVSFLLNLGKFGLSLGSDLGFLTSSKADVIRSYLQDSLSQKEVIEELQYDFINDQSGNNGAYWEQPQSSELLFDRLNFGANLAFQFNLLKNLGLEIKTNYGFGDIMNDLSYASSNGFGRQLDLLLSAKYTFPIKIRKKIDKDKEDHDTPND